LFYEAVHRESNDVNMNEIKASRIQLSAPDVGREEQRLMLEALDSRWDSPHAPHLDAFEQELGDRLGGLHAVALSSEAAGLEMALQAAGVRPGDTVLLSDFASAAAPFSNCTKNCLARHRSGTRGQGVERRDQKPCTREDRPPTSDL
jgi:hypothetical protein